MPPTKLTSSKRFAVRVSLVTGSTLAVIIGAQSLASLDKKTANVPDISAPVVVDPSLLPSDTSSLENRSLIATPTSNTPGITVHAAPVITILRHPGQSGGTTSAQPSVSSIKPPDPVQLAAPEPIVVQAPGQVIQVAGSAPAAAAPSRPTTRSSR